MPMLFVKCPKCGQPFPSGVAPTAGTPGGVALLEVLERCPSCAAEGRYNTPEYFFPEIAGPTSESPVTPPLVNAVLGGEPQPPAGNQPAIEPPVPGRRAAVVAPTP